MATCLEMAGMNYSLLKYNSMMSFETIYNYDLFYFI